MMTDEEFNRIVNEGALSHPLIMFRLTRAYLCLRIIIQTVPGAEDAFRKWCRERDERDQGEEYEEDGENPVP